MTWVLFVIVFSAIATQPVGVTSVPGYKSQADCQVARNELLKEFSAPKLQIQADCIPGPGQ
jgi:hypothetical protein